MNNRGTNRTSTQVKNEQHTISQKLLKAESDLSEKQKMVEQLKLELEEVRNSEEKYRLLAQFSNHWELFIERDGRFTFVSPGSKDLTGYTHSEFLKNNTLFYSIIHPEDQESVRTFINNTLNFSILGDKITYRLFTRTRQLKQVELSMRAVYNAFGNYLGHKTSVHDISRLISALDKLETVTASKQFETITKLKYKDQSESKDRELVGSLLKTAQQIELLEFIKKQLESIPQNPSALQQWKQNISQRITSTLNSEGQWEEFRWYFEKSHPGFFDRLVHTYPILTSRDLKLCAYLKLQLSTKEISSLLNITSKSVEVSRTRLRKKLRLKRSDGLANFLLRI